MEHITEFPQTDNFTDFIYLREVLKETLMNQYIAICLLFRIA